MKTIFAVLNRMERFVTFSTTLAVVGLLCVAVFLRYVLNTDLYAIDEPEIAIAFWMYFISSAHASNQRRQITADILSFMITSARGKCILKFLTSAITALITGIFAYLSVGMVVFSFLQNQRTLVWRIPRCTYNLAVLVGLTLMSFYAVRDAVLAARELRAVGAGEAVTAGEEIER